MQAQQNPQTQLLKWGGYGVPGYGIAPTRVSELRTLTSMVAGLICSASNRTATKRQYKLFTYLKKHRERSRAILVHDTRHLNRLAQRQQCNYRSEVGDSLIVLLSSAL